MIIPILARAVYTDIKTGKIENKLILTAMILAMMMDYVVGGAGLLISGIKMAVIMVAVLFLLFVVKGLGAGDIKLIGAIGMFFPDMIIRITMVSFILAGIWSIARMLIRILRKKEAVVKGDTIHFSIPIALGTAVVICMELMPGLKGGL